MSYDLKRLRQEIATAVATIDGLNVSAYLPNPMLPTPCAFLIPKTILYGYTIPRLNQKSYFSLQLLIGRQKDLSESQSDIDEYISYLGTKSLYAAVSAGTYTEISHVHLETLDQYGGFNYYDTMYLGALFTIETY